MYLSTAISLVLSLAVVATAQLSAAPIIQKIAPGAASCDDTKDCRTAKQAAPWIAKGMSTYNIYDINEMAAIISLMAFESGDFKYKHNVFPGRPGQGTANMQMATYNLMYAQQIDALKAEVSDIKSVDGLSDDQLNHILSLVTPDEYNFASGPWFLTTQCPKDVRDKLKSNVDEGFTAYMQCVGVTTTDDRMAYFNRAKAAFGLE